MKRNIEGRLAKLETTKAPNDGQGDFIFEVISADETVEEFDRRVDALVRESTERDGVEPSVVFRMVLNHAGQGQRGFKDA
jgi:hypothetical protein